MITEKENKRISKFLSLVLRHQPELIDISLDAHGWTDVETLLLKMESHGISISRQVLQHVVDTNAKKRFALNDDQSKIRANQGHSVEVNLNYAPSIPPEILYHGTAKRFMSSIMMKGLEKRERHHVHLSADEATAMNVGSRHGKPVVLQIAAQKMYRDGYAFYLSENKVWLADHVPVIYIESEFEVESSKKLAVLNFQLLTLDFRLLTTSWNPASDSLPLLLPLNLVNKSHNI